VQSTSFFTPFVKLCINILSSAEAQRVFFSGGVDPLSNVSAGTELRATAESVGASARYHTQDGRHPGRQKMAGKILRFSNV